MIIQVDPTGTVDGFLSMLKEITANPDVKGLLVLACDANGFTPDRIDTYLKQVSIPLFGGIFPAILHECDKLDKGTLIVGLRKPPSVFTLPCLSDTALDLDETIENLIPDSGNAGTMFVFVDGYSQRIMPLIDSLYNTIGMGLSYLGGGAGSIKSGALDMKNKPCLFSNSGLIKDSAVLALVDLETGIGAAHGWHKISGPYKVTASRGNVIESLDLRPAFEVYREIVRQHSGSIITETNFFDIAKQYPFGISRLEAEVIVRDPFTVDGDRIVVATPIPQESFIDIMTGNPDSLVSAAERSAAAGLHSYQGEEPRAVFVVDCISRVLFLGDDFPREIAAVYREGWPLIGVLSLGEIGNSGNDYMELYNKTCVVGIIGE